MQLRDPRPSQGDYAVHAYWLGAASAVAFLLLGISLVELLKSQGPIQSYAIHATLVVASMGLCMVGVWMGSRKFIIENNRIEIFVLFGIYRVGSFERKYISVRRVRAGKYGEALSFSFRTPDGKSFSVGVGAKNWQMLLDWINGG